MNINYEKYKETIRRWKIKNAERLARYKEENKEHISHIQKEWYERNKDKRSRQNRKLVQKYVAEWKNFISHYREFECELCGYDASYAALQWHHEDPDSKLFRISSLTHYKPTEERKAIVKAELEKCILVCANCHAELHYEV